MLGVLTQCSSISQSLPDVPHLSPRPHYFLSSACTDKEHAKCTVRVGQVGLGELSGCPKALVSFPTCDVSTVLEELNVMSCEPKG